MLIVITKLEGLKAMQQEDGEQGISQDDRSGIQTVESMTPQPVRYPRTGCRTIFSKDVRQVERTAMSGNPPDSSLAETHRPDGIISAHTRIGERPDLKRLRRCI